MKITVRDLAPQDVDAELLVAALEVLALLQPLVETNVDGLARAGVDESENMDIVADPRVTFDGIDAVEQSMTYRR